ncbi:MAG: 30S ribosomal protein S12 methylthiotransferase RimO [Dialister invisus]|uniref:30S ribosomal protein S12 methylthiotransferase RimO n=1 Tax=Dialister invisus TaxID=218538 RepID=UPI00399378DA
MNRKLGVISLGCSKNLVDTEMMVGILAKAGYELTEDLSTAQIIIINTCTFIDLAKEESIQTILQVAQYKKEGVCEKLVAAGCLTQQYKKVLGKEIPEIDIFIGTDSWQHVLEAVQESYDHDDKKVYMFGTAPCEHEELLPRQILTPSYSAYIKIAEGCSNGCTFCYIPYVRGAMRSRSISSVVHEVKRLSREGVREFNLIAQDSSFYGRDLNDGTTLAKLLKELVKIDDVKWIRLFYLYPTYFDEELLEIITNEEKICKYVDIPLQHISDSVLRRMHRRDSSKSIKTLLKKLRNTIPYITIRTTLMVGFPGETEEDFKELLAFIKAVKFDNMGAFTYSAQAGTPAARMVDQIAEKIKENRYHELMAVQAEISEENNRNLIGIDTEVLVEELLHDGCGNFQAKGRASFQAPEVDGDVYIDNPGNLQPGDFVKVHIIDGYAYDLIAERI